MTIDIPKGRNSLHTNKRKFILLSLTIALITGSVAYAQKDSDYFLPGNLVVSRTVYDNNPSTIQPGATLPPNCASTLGGCPPRAANPPPPPPGRDNHLPHTNAAPTTENLPDPTTPSAPPGTSTRPPH